MENLTLAPGLALIFDLDGVIIDSMPTHTEAWIRYMERLGLPCEDIERRMHGRRNDEIVIDLMGTGLTPEQIFAHGAAKEALFREMIGGELQDKLVPGAVAFINALRGCPLGLASNAEPENIRFVIHGAHLDGAFQVLVDGMQVEHPKPWPDVYLKASEKLGIAPANCIIFEDSPTGVTAARRAGARVVGVETHAPLDDVDLRVPNFLDPRLGRWLAGQRPV